MFFLAQPISKPHQGSELTEAQQASETSCSSQVRGVYHNIPFLNLVSILLQ